jgi:hypothetical protein
MYISKYVMNDHGKNSLSIAALKIIMVPVLLLVFQTKVWSQSEQARVNIYSTSAPVSFAGFMALRTVPPAIKPVLAAPYDIRAIDKKLRTDRRIIISGGVLTGCGLALFGLGLGVMLAPTGDTRGGGDFGVIIVMIPGAAVTAAGIPLLTVGLTERHKWQKRKNELNVQTGLLSNGHVGMTMTF